MNTPPSTFSRRDWLRTASSGLSHPSMDGGHDSSPTETARHAPLRLPSLGGSYNA